MNNMTQIFDISEVENGLSLFKEDKPFSDEKKLKVYYISDMHLEHHFNYEISIQKQINKIVKDLFSDDFKSDLSMNNLVVLFNGDIADNAEFVSLFFNQFILRWNYVLYKRYKVNQSNILPDEEVKAYEKIRDQQIDRLNKIGKLYKKKNLCEKLLSLDISDLDKSIKKMKLPEYVINIIEKITKCDYKIRFINNYIIPYVEKKKPKKKVILWSGIIIILMLVMLTFVLPTLSNAAAGNITFGGDSRGGDTGVVRQIVSMIKHPWASVKLMLVSVFKFDNFRNLGYDTADNFFFGNLMCLNFAHNGILSDKWSAILLPICIILLLYKTPSETVRGRHSMSMLNKFIVLIAVAGTIFLVWLALYLDFTPVGAEYIAGVQARYYLPLLYLGALLFAGRKVTINWSEETITKLTYSAATLLGFALMYQGMLQGRII